MSILSVDNISPIGSGTSVTVNSAATLVLNNANSTGVITATSFVGSGANISGVLKNIVEDSSPQLGSALDTNGKNINFGNSTGGGANNRLVFGTASDLNLYSDGTNVRYEGNNLHFKNANGDEYHAKMTNGGSVELYYNDNRKFSTEDYGVKIHDAILEIADTSCLIDLMETSSTNHRIRNGSGNFYIQKLSDDKNTTTDQLVIDGGTGETALHHSGNKKLATKSTGVSISGILEFEGGSGTYSTNSNSTWQTLFTFSNANNNGFSMECAVAENNYSTIYKVGGSAMWNSCYFTSDHAGDSQHAHSSDIEFRVLNDSGTKRLQFKAVSYTTTRYLTVISLWVKSGSVTWS